MTEEIAKMWADIISYDVRAEYRAALGHWVVVSDYYRVDIKTARECFDAALAEREPQPDSQ